MEELERIAYRRVFESIRNPVVLLDREGRIRTMNHEAVLLVDEWAAPGHAYYGPTGSTDADARATRIRVLFGGRLFAEVFPWIDGSMPDRDDTGADMPPFECTLRRADVTRSFEARVSRVLDAREEVDGSLVILTEVTEGKVLLRRLRELATTDTLTGVANRRAFFERALAEIERTRRYGRPLTLLLLDVDHFKRVNDVHGHHVGDEVLRVLSRTARAALRACDAFARLGGEEFAALLPETALEAGRTAAERLRERLAAEVVRIEGREVRITVSIGVAMLRRDEGEVESILRRADAALYEAKRAGRDRVMAEEEALPLR